MNESIDNIVSARNRVFETINGPAIGKSVAGAMSTKDTSIYRITGRNQLKDILATGYVRPKEGKLKGGHQNEVFWSHGSDKLYYFDKSKDHIIVEVSATDIKDNQLGAIPFDKIIGIWEYNEENNTFENRINMYQKVFLDIHTNHDILNGRNK